MGIIWLHWLWTRNSPYPELWAPTLNYEPLPWAMSPYPELWAPTYWYLALVFITLQELHLSFLHLYCVWRAWALLCILRLLSEWLTERKRKKRKKKEQTCSLFHIPKLLWICTNARKQPDNRRIRKLACLFQEHTLKWRKMKKEMKIRGPDALQGLLLEALPLGDKGGGG